MDSLSNLFPGIAKKIGDSGYFSRREYDTIKFLRFEDIYFKKNSPNVCILIGYERGFEIWDLSSDPVLVFSKRNQGISLVSYIPNPLQVQLVIAPLYDTSEFPLNSFQVFSVLENKTIMHIRTEDIIYSMQCNRNVLAIGLPTKIELYSCEGFQKIYHVNVSNAELIFSMSGGYIACAVAYKHENSEERDGKIRDVISKTVHSIAETGINTIKTYIDTSNSSNCLYGKIWVKNIMNNSLVCEIQAFTTAVSALHFSKTSHFLIVSPITGFSFHVYRINPPKEIKSEYKNRYFLLYKLYRGVTPAEINDIAMSEDEKLIVVSSSRGTCHIYAINPESTNLCYNQEVFCRIKLGSFLEKHVYPRCHINLSRKMQPKLKGSLQNTVLEQCPCEVVTITNLGYVSKYTIEVSPIQVSSTCILRGKNFKEITGAAPASVQKKTNESEFEYADITYPGWVPLTRSPQFCIYITDDEFQNCLQGDMELRVPTDEKRVPGFTVYYENYSRLQEAMDASIPSTQVAPHEIDCQFLETSTPPFKSYLNEKFNI